MHVSYAILMTLHLVPSNLSNKSISTKKDDSILNKTYSHSSISRSYPKLN